MSNRYQNEPPGPWEIDENGRRFRRVGHGCIEYPMQITTSYGTFDADNMPAPPKRSNRPTPKAGANAPLFPSAHRNVPYTARPAAPL